MLTWPNLSMTKLPKEVPLGILTVQTYLLDIGAFWTILLQKTVSHGGLLL